MHILTQSQPFAVILQLECVLAGYLGLFSFLVPHTLPTLHFELLAGELLIVLHSVSRSE